MLSCLARSIGRSAPIVARTSPLVPLRHRCHSCSKANFDTVRLVQKENPNTWHLILEKQFSQKWCGIQNLRVFSQLPPPIRLVHCDNPQCKTCAVLRETRPEIRTLNHGWMEEKELSCRSSNLVYALECRGCGVLYVGETRRELRHRVSTHLHVKANGPMSIHYRSDGDICPLCAGNSNESLQGANLDNFDVMILESLTEEDFGNPLEQGRLRRARERWWMQKLHTVWPLGLNNRGHRFADVPRPHSSLISV